MQSRASQVLKNKAITQALSRPFHHASTSTRGATPFAQVPAVAEPSSPSLVSLIFGKTSKQGPSMFEPLASAPVLPPRVDSPVRAPTEITKLANGLTIASQDMPGATACVGVFVSSGSAWESPYDSGFSHLLERMAFKSTANRTHFRLVREIEAIGANCMAAASREQMVYSASVIKLYVPEAVELLADTVRNSVFNDWEVKEQAAKLAGDVETVLRTSPETVLVEAMHSAGYVGALGNPLMASPALLGKANGQALFDFVATNYSPPRIVVAASGVEHAEFKDTVEPLFADMPSAPAPLAPQSKYIGGDVRMAADTPLTYLGFGFEFAGGWRNEKEATTAVLFQALMGGGLSFSAGGPGKGMFTRLYQRVLNRYADAQSCSFFASIYDNTGLLGVQASCPAAFIPNMVDVIVNELTAVAKPGGVTAEELQRAKNATIAGVLMNLETKAVSMEDIGRQILTYGHRKPPQEFVDQLNAITPADITTFAQKMLKTPLTFAAYGDVVHVPRFDQISARFS